MGKPECPGENPLVGRRENPTDINFDERACHQSSGKQNHIKKRKEKKGGELEPEKFVLQGLQLRFNQKT